MVLNIRTCQNFTVIQMVYLCHLALQNVAQAHTIRVAAVPSVLQIHLNLTLALELVSPVLTGYLQISLLDKSLVVRQFVFILYVYLY